MTRSTHTFTCNLCESACGLRVELQDGERVVSIRGNPDDVISHGHICAKAHALGELLEDPHRIRAPQQIGDAPLGLQLSGVQDGHTVRDILDIGQQVRSHQDRLAGLRQQPHEILDLAAGDGVES